MVQFWRDISIQLSQITSPDATKVLLVLIHEETIPVPFYSQRKVVGNPFVHFHPGCPSEGASQVYPFFYIR